MPFITFPERESTPLTERIIIFFTKVLLVSRQTPFSVVAVKTLDPLVQNLKLRFNHEDLKMKKMMLNLLVLMSKDLAALQVSHSYM